MYVGIAVQMNKLLQFLFVVDRYNCHLLMAANYLDC